MSAAKTTTGSPADGSRPEIDPGTMHGALTWILASARTPDLAIADLLVRDLDPGCAGVVDLLTSDRTPVEILARAKGLFKTLRMAGETRHDRRMGAILYACTIAAALVRFDEHISVQRRDTLRKAFVQIEADAALPPELRALARDALARVTASKTAPPQPPTESTSSFPGRPPVESPPSSRPDPPTPSVPHSPSSPA
jgi:hypothetical protein